MELKLIPLGGVGTVTRNMYVYELDNEILLVDCGLGFADETMLGVDLLIPDIAYLQTTTKKIVGMLLTHGHEDHIGALPFILPQLPKFPVYGTPLTAGFANEKLKEFGQEGKVQKIPFEGNSNPVTLGKFSAQFIRVTHSVPDTAHIFIKTPAGNIYHGSDFKFDLTPADGHQVEFDKIAQAAKDGVVCLLSDCLGAERNGATATEKFIEKEIEQAMRECKGKFILTTYSSNIARLQQTIDAAKVLGKKVVFIGRSLIKAKDVAKEMGYLKIPKGMEISINQMKGFVDKDLVLFVAGSQGQENSAMTRIANGEHKEIELRANDSVMFSSDAIPGNEVAVNSLIDAIVGKGAKALYSDDTDSYHVSGHGSSYDLMLLMELIKPKYLLPIGGQMRHMVAYKERAETVGYDAKHVLLLEAGQELRFHNNSVTFGKKHDVKNVYVDEISGEEVESYVLRDRQRISKEGIVVVMAQIDSETGEVIEKPDILIRGFTIDKGQNQRLSEMMSKELKGATKNKKQRIIDWNFVRKTMGEATEKVFFKEFRRRPLVLPIVIEV